MSESAPTSHRSRFNVWHYALALMLAWTAVIAASLVWNKIEERTATLDNARHEAQISFQKKLLLLFWMNSHGGSAPATNNAQPSPEPARAAERALVSEPMLRQMQELSSELAGNRSHLASLKPTWPENAPDAWEAGALQAFAKGETEVTSVTTMDGQEYMRVMRPLVNEASCQSCHGAQDYKVGEIRGGLSVAVPLAPLWATAQSELSPLVITSGVIWVLGLGLIGFGARRTRTHNLERARAETVLREAMQRLDSHMANSPIAVLEFDPTFRVVRWSDQAERVFGWRRDEILGKAITEMRWVVEEDAETVRRVSEDMLAGRRPRNLNVNRNYRKDGTVIQCEWYNSAIYDDQGRLTSTLSLVLDITERKRAEEETRQLLAEVSESRRVQLSVIDDLKKAETERERLLVRAETSRRALLSVVEDQKLAAAALRQSEERYRLLFDNNPLPMWLSDAETLRFLAVNESAVLHYGYTSEEFLGMTIQQIRPPEDIPALAKSFEEGPTEATRTGEFRHRKKDGTILHVEIISRALIFGGRTVRLVLANDVTEKKLFEEKFLHAQRLESIGMLAAGIAHDLNNVLAPVVFAAPLLRGSLSAPRDLKILDILEQSAGRGAGLVKQILGFAHSTTGEFRPTQVKHLARDIISVTEQTFPKSIQLEHQIPTDLWPVQGDATQIHQVLLNLCVNARDAMPQGGTLRIVLANRRLDAAEAGAIPGARPGAWLVLEVADTGTGIPPEVLERIWTPFFTTKGAGKGTGLGLSTVRGIVASHHGFVELHTEVGRGTTFRVFLPAVAAESLRPDSAPPFAIPDGYGELILVVDDDALIRDIVSNILETHGYRVVSGVDGLDAIAMFDAHPGEISLVVTDVDMPRLGGVGLAQALLQIRPDIRLLAMSGLSRSETSAPGIPEVQKLAHAFLLKPFKPDDLLGAVHRLLHPSA